MMYLVMSFLAGCKDPFLKQAEPPINKRIEASPDRYEGTFITVNHDRWFTRGFSRFLVFGSDGRVFESPEPVFEF